MTKSSNVEVIVDRMIDYMISINDSHYKTEIASRCVELAEQFAPSNQWFIQVRNDYSFPSPCSTAADSNHVLGLSSDNEQSI